MHAAQREAAIFQLISDSGFVSFRELERTLEASPATIRRDLDRLATEGRVVRVHGGAKLPNEQAGPGSLTGVPFHQNINRNREAKEAIGKAAAALCKPGEGVIIDGGSTTLQMCAHLDGLGLQVLTNSLHIVSALLPQAFTRITVPGGTVFREQNIVLSAGDDLVPRFHAPKLFMGAAAVGPQGVMQADILLVAAERQFIDRAEQLILLVDSSKFEGSSGNVVCDLSEIDVLVTDSGIQKSDRKMLKDAGIKVIVAD
jgi:DeoR family ulaG and ulaABCDEF operon transcriptional repressor